MKFKTLALLFLCLAAGTLPISAADTLQQTFQKGLFEEEGNQNLPAAIQAYESVLSQLDQQRKIAATTVFRLGECYRKLGRTNEATAQYQRVVREFGDQEILAKLSQQNLVALNPKSTLAAKAGEPVAATNAEAVEVERIKALIKDSPDLVNAVTSQGTPLHKAASQGQLAVAGFLLASKADVNASDNERKTPLHLAVDRGHKTMVELLLAHKADVNVKGNYDYTPLHSAVGMGYRAVAEVLINAHANLETQTGGGDAFYNGPPLFGAINRGDKTMIEMLVSRGADVNVANSFGVTALHLAAHRGQVEVVEFLLKNQANANVAISAQFGVYLPALPGRNQQNIGPGQGFTPLHLAAITGKKELVQLLLTHKADVNVRAANERTPLNLAAEWGTTDVVRLLLEHGADVNTVETSKSSVPLHFAVARQLRDMVQAILAHKPRLEYQNTAHFTPLHQAVEKGDVEIVDLLLQAGADPNITRGGGYTPLHVAVDLRNRKMVELLLRHKANVQATDSSERTALDHTIAVQPQPVPQSSTPGRPVRQPIQRQDAALAEIADLLKQASAREEGSQRSSMILIGRNDAYYPGFSKGTNDLNRYTLFELLMASYYRYQNSFPELRVRGGYTPSFAQPMSSSLAFPDFSRIVIHRPDRGGETEIKVDLANAFQAGDCSKDVGLEWGDKVEIPETDHKLNERWEGLSVEASESLRKCLQRKVKIAVKGQVTEVMLDPFAPILDALQSLQARYRQGNLTPDELTLMMELQRVANPQLALAPTPGLPATPQLGIPATPGVPILAQPSATAPTAPSLVIGSFRLGEVLRSANILRTSSDLARVKVKRTDPATKEIKELVLNVERADLKTDLWLRDGDVIEVPEKE